jgi:hypothetical protein
MGLKGYAQPRWRYRRLLGNYSTFTYEARGAHHDLADGCQQLTVFHAREPLRGRDGFASADLAGREAIPPQVRCAFPGYTS